MAQKLNSAFVAGVAASVFAAVGYVYVQHQEDAAALKELSRLETESVVEKVAGASVYKLPAISKMNLRKMKLFDHYKPLRAAAGWTHAFIEFPTPSEARVWVEEIPPRTTKLIGRTGTGMYLFTGISGKGYTEWRDPAKMSAPGQGTVWNPGDRFYVRFGSWYGHANPFDQPARILTIAFHLDDNDILNPYLGTTRTVPEMTFPGERRDPVPPDTVVEELDWKTVMAGANKSFEAEKLEIERRGPSKTVTFLTPGGAVFNMIRNELPASHKKLRSDDGWKGIHLDAAYDLGYRALFTNLQEIPPGSKEVGHKHGGGVWWIGLKGKGYMALRATSDSPEARIDWEPYDLWYMPWMTAGGTWHSHANPYQEPARIMGSSVVWDDDGLLDGRIDRVRHFAADGVGYGAPDKIFKPRTSPPK
jgi:hypothetical protein